MFPGDTTHLRRHDGAIHEAKLSLLRDSREFNHFSIARSTVLDICKSIHVHLNQSLDDGSDAEDAGDAAGTAARTDPTRRTAILTRRTAILTRGRKRPRSVFRPLSPDPTTVRSGYWRSGRGHLSSGIPNVCISIPPFSTTSKLSGTRHTPTYLPRAIQSDSL